MGRRRRPAPEGGRGRGPSDAHLLELFAGRTGDDSARAFAELVERHGSMVRRVCLAVTRDEHEALDASQAVFLLLARKARGLWVRDSLGPWLHGVALRVAARSRAASARRRRHERKRAESAPVAADEELPLDPVAPLIHEEIGRLPDPYRAAVVLCDLEGLTHEQAAARLGWPVGTVKSRQSRGRERLRARLIRRGLGPSVGIAAVAAAPTSGASVASATIAEAAVRVAIREA